MAKFTDPVGASPVCHRIMKSYLQVLNWSVVSAIVATQSTQNALTTDVEIT